MAGHPILDDPAWHALGGPHARFADDNGPLRRYRSEFTPFVGARTARDRESLASFLPRGAIGVFMIPEEIAVPPGLEAITVGLGVQMVADTPVPATVTVEPVALGPADASEMIALAELTQPGPFLERTVEIGRYIGLRENGRLIAMAGERMHPPGYTEVSAVCTHPDHRGRGYGRQLISAIMEGIMALGETPFLHTRAGNADAIRLYETLGFRLTHDVYFTVLKHAGAEIAVPEFLRHR